MLKIPYGESNFESIRKDGFIYVDKTHFIEQLESIRRLIHLRPRRFGKSLFISMLEAYYDVAQADKFETLFKGLYIYDKPTPDKNNYYILRLNFSGIQNMREGDIEEGFNGKVFDGCNSFIKKYQMKIDINEKDRAATTLKKTLSGVKHLECPHKVYILIDEYDHFTNALLTGDGIDFLTILQRGGFVRAFYEIIKEQSEIGTVERLFMTGVMSVTLDSMTSGFNVGTNITTTEEFADMMGFTTEEVKEILQQTYARPGKKDEVVNLTQDEQEVMYGTFKDNYNGYLFSEESKIKVFNATLIMYYMKHYLRNNKAPKNLIDDNLKQTGSTIESIVTLKNKEQNYEVIEQIVEKGEVSGTLQPYIWLEEKFDEEDLITLLFNIGMLTIKGHDMETQFTIPNKIIKDIYYQYLQNLLQQTSACTFELSKQKEAITALGRYGEIDLLIVTT